MTAGTMTPESPSPARAEPTERERFESTLLSRGWSHEAFRRSIMDGRYAEGATDYAWVGWNLRAALAVPAASQPDLSGMVWRACIHSSLPWEARERVVKAFEKIIATPSPDSASQQAAGEAE